MTNLLTIFAERHPNHVQRLSELRVRILSIGKGHGVGPIKETLKWGEPAFVPPKRTGTTIRLGARDHGCAMFVHCQTTLVQDWRSLFPDAFTYEGNRAVLIPATGPYPEDAFDHMVAMALTYHRVKQSPK